MAPDEKTENPIKQRRKLAPEEKRVLLVALTISFLISLGPLSRCSMGPLTAASTIGGEYNTTIDSGIVPSWSAWMNPLGTMILQDFEHQFLSSLRWYRFTHSLGWSYSCILIFFVTAMTTWFAVLFPLFWLRGPKGINTRMGWVLHRLFPIAAPLAVYAAIACYYVVSHRYEIHRTQMLNYNMLSLSAPLFDAKPPVFDAATSGSTTVIINDYSKAQVPAIDFKRYWFDPQRDFLAFRKYKSGVDELQAEARRVAAASGISSEEMDRLFMVALEYEQKISRTTFMIPIRFELWNRNGTEYWICEWGWEHFRQIKNTYAIPAHVQIFAIRRSDYKLAGWETCM